MADDIDVDDILAEHKNETKDGRVGTEPTSDSADTDDEPTLEEHVREGYHKIDDGDVPRNLTIRDENLAALFYGLKQSEQLADVGYDAAALLDRDPKNVATNAGLLRLLVRVGLDEIDDSLLEAGEEGRDRYKDDQEDPF